MRSISAVQCLVLGYLAEGYQLQNSYATEEEPGRPRDGMHSGTLFDDRTAPLRLPVPYRTIAALLSRGWIKVERQVPQGWVTRDGRRWRYEAIAYSLTEAGRAKRNDACSQELVGSRAAPTTPRVGSSASLLEKEGIYREQRS
jgi:hypothetical protein